MGYFYVAISPSQFTAEQRRGTERDHPGLRFPDEGRLPSRRDFDAVFHEHPQWQVELDQGPSWWTAEVRSRSEFAELRVDDYSGDPAREHRFSFGGGDLDLVLEITGALAKRCGPFLIAGEGGDIVVMVYPDGSRSDVGETRTGGARPPVSPPSS